MGFVCEGCEEGDQGSREEAQGWEEEEHLDGRGNVGTSGQTHLAHGTAQQCQVSSGLNTHRQPGNVPQDVSRRQNCALYSRLFCFVLSPETTRFWSQGGPLSARRCRLRRHAVSGDGRKHYRGCVCQRWVPL